MKIVAIIIPIIYITYVQMSGCVYMCDCLVKIKKKNLRFGKLNSVLEKRGLIRLRENKKLLTLIEAKLVPRKIDAPLIVGKISLKIRQCAVEAIDFRLMFDVMLAIFLLTLK